MALPPAAARAGLTDTGDGADPRSSRLRLVVAVLLALVCLVAAGVLAWQLSRDGEAGARLDRAETRERVMSVTDQFVKRLGTYSPDLLDASGQMPDYREQVRDAKINGYASSVDEVIRGVTSLAVPLHTSNTLPAALAVVFATSTVQEHEKIVRALKESALVISEDLS